MGYNNLKIGFRVDADNVIGTGHLMEVISIIKRLRKKIIFEPIIITHKNYFTIEKLKTFSLGNIACIASKISEEEEAEKILAILRKVNCEYLVLDLLGRSNKFYSCLRENLKSIFVILDNSEQRKIPATVVINFSITQNLGFYKEAGNNYFIGPKYAVLDDDITRKKSICIRHKVKAIFVTQGGADPCGLTAKIIRSLLNLKLKQEINVIVGGALTPNHLKELEYLKLNLADNYHFYNNIHPGDMLGIMERSDLALTAPGNTLYELAYFGIPALVISQHRQHQEVAGIFEKRGAVIDLGIGDVVPEESIAKAVNNIIYDKNKRAYLSKNCKKIVDGKGTNRVIDILMKAIGQNSQSET